MNAAETKNALVDVGATDEGVSRSRWSGSQNEVPAPAKEQNMSSLSPIPSDAPSDLVHIPFHGTDLLTVDVDGRPHVVLKPAVEALGVDFDSQRQKLSGKSWASTVLTTVVAADGKKRHMLTANLRTFTMLLATIDERRVSDAARPLLIAYQSEVADVIEAYWTRGGAINPRASEDQLDRLTRQAKAQVEVLAAASGIVDAKWLEGKTRIVLARALGEVPEIEPLDMPLYVHDYLREKGLGRAIIGSIESPFGRRVSNAFKAATGARPEKVPGDVGTKIKERNAYTQRDRHYMDRVWDEHYADTFDVDLFGEVA